MKCDCCEKVARSVRYEEEWDEFLCGPCWQQKEDGLEQYEEDKRQRIAESQEY
jgi:hypothetical protein